MAARKSVAEPVPVPPAPPACDGCNIATATHEITTPSGFVYLCGHHYRKHAAAFVLRYKVREL